jgi:hypothetical protein
MDLRFVSSSHADSKAHRLFQRMYGLKPVPFREESPTSGAFKALNV